MSILDRALSGGFLLNDSGLETTLVFQDGKELPSFAAFPILDDAEGRAWFSSYCDRHLDIAARHGTGYVLSTPTWRASADWGPDLGYDAAGLHRINIDAVVLARSIAARWGDRVAPILIDGVIGPRGDGYKAGRMTEEESQAYHAAQIDAFRAAGADLVTAQTLSTIEEAVGIVRAAGAAALPVAISFTVETDGRLASGTTLGEAIAEVDRRTGGGPDYFMINCAHPTHFSALFTDPPPWAHRIRGLKANASTMSHAELDNMTELDDGDPEDLGARYAALRQSLPSLSILGGCCGTDHRHVGAIAEACFGHR